MTFLLGKQAMFGQDPPISLRSTTAVRRPAVAIVQARFLPASPLPIMRNSNCCLSAMAIPKANAHTQVVPRFRADQFPRLLVQKRDTRLAMRVRFVPQYPENSSVLMSSSSTLDATSIFLMLVTMAGGPAM